MLGPGVWKGGIEVKGQGRGLPMVGLDTPPAGWYLVLRLHPFFQGCPPRVDSEGQGWKQEGA